MQVSPVLFIAGLCLAIIITPLLPGSMGCSRAGGARAQAIVSRRRLGLVPPPSFSQSAFFVSCVQTLLLIACVFSRFLLRYSCSVLHRTPRQHIAPCGSSSSLFSCLLARPLFHAFQRQTSPFNRTLSCSARLGHYEPSDCGMRGAWSREASCFTVLSMLSCLPHTKNDAFHVVLR